ncbi:MAG: M3 family oligoendopeptidase [Gemmataceae bacterium]|nr:M3 family oligoendopeptidase [Gemmataceae bacterium]
MPAPTSTAANVAWDLGDLYKGIDDPVIERDMQFAKDRAASFEATYRGKIATLSDKDAETLFKAAVELESLYEVMDKPSIYASLLHAAQSEDPRHGALVARTREQRTLANKHLIFFDLELIKVSDDAAKALFADPRLAKYRHWLEVKLLWKPYFLSEPEEKILEEKSLTGRGAFVRLFEEMTSSARFPLKEPDGQERRVSQSEVLAKLYDADRAQRQTAGEALTVGLQEIAKPMTFIFNTVVQDHRSDTNLRKYPSVMFGRNLSNEITADVVEALMAAVEQAFPLVQRYYRLKKQLLGFDQLYDYDRYAPLFSDSPTCDWANARKIVQASYDSFSPKAGSIVREFFDKRWIDAELRDGKRGGAFSASAVPSAHPYILMNFTDRIRDVMTLAHELGHGVHQYLSRGQGYLQCDTPLTTAEMASVFGEMLTFRRLQEVYPEPRLRLAMLCGKIEDAFATVFRQVVLTQFEQRLHQARQDQGELSTAGINKLWFDVNQAMFGDSVTLTEGYAWWWSYIGHFIRSPFYCYAYAFGELLVLALYQKYLNEGEAFVERYLALLSSGGSDAPHLLLAKLGVDVTDPGFWSLGLKLLEKMVADAESLAAQATK